MNKNTKFTAIFVVTVVFFVNFGFWKIIGFLDSLILKNKFKYLEKNLKLIDNNFKF